MAQKGELQAQLNALQSKLTSIRSEIAKLSGTSRDRILEAIKKQRWYFFKNKTKVLMDRNTGLLWASLDYFPWCKNGDPEQRYGVTGAKNAVEQFDGGDIHDWRIPQFDELKEMIEDKTFPYQEGSHYRIKGRFQWLCNTTGYSDNVHGVDVDNFSTTSNDSNYVIPCSDHLVENTDYKNNVSPNNLSYYRERTAAVHIGSFYSAWALADL